MFCIFIFCCTTSYSTYVHLFVINLLTYLHTIQYNNNNTIQCESLVGQVAHPIFLICCGRASLLFGVFVQVVQCCWIVGYIAFRFAVGLCVFGLVSGITYVVWVSWVLCHVLSWLVSSCVMLFICIMTFCRISFISSVAFSLSLKYVLYGCVCG